MESTDNYISQDTGRIHHKRGKSDPYNMFSGGCVFFDHTSGFMSIKHQVDVNSFETVKAKPNFEREAKNQEVDIKG